MPWAEVGLIAAEEVGGAVIAEGAAATFAAGAAEAAATAGAYAISDTAVADLGTQVVADAASSTAATATGTSEISGAGPAAQTGEVAQSQTDKLAQQILQNPDTGSGAAADVTTNAEKGFVEGSKPGIIDSAVKWAGDHPVAATIMGTQLAGAVGGVGKAALDKEIQQRNIKARSDLLTQQTAEQLDLSRRGTLTGSVPIKPGASNVLRRPDGTPVYGATGLINRNLPPTP